MAVQAMAHDCSWERLLATDGAVHDVAWGAVVADPGLTQHGDGWKSGLKQIPHRLAGTTRSPPPSPGMGGDKAELGKALVLLLDKAGPSRKTIPWHSLRRMGPATEFVTLNYGSTTKL